MVNLVIRYDLKPVIGLLEQLRDGGRLAISRALNRTLLTTRTAARRAIAEDVGLRQKDIEAAMKIIRATADRLRAELQVSGGRIPLIRFRTRETRAGVTYSLRGSRSLAPRAFIATMRSGHEGVFRRRRVGGDRTRTGVSIHGRQITIRELAHAGPGLVPRLPIDELFGPSLPHVFAGAKVAPVIQRTAEVEMQKNLAHEVRFLVSQQGAPRGGEAA
jgi:hypothetical protein